MRFVRTSNRAAIGAVALVVALTPLTSLSAPAPVDSGTQVPAFCDSSGPVRAAWLAEGVRTSDCDLVGRTVVARGVAVQVPASGSGVAADGLTTVGESHLELENVDGVVTAVVGQQRGRFAHLSAAPPKACKDGAFNLGPRARAWESALRWRYRSSSTPNRFGPKQTLRQIKLGMQNMRDGRDDCGLQGQPRMTAKYVGPTQVKANIFNDNGTAKCGPANQTNSVDWGFLPGPFLGLACVWWNGQNELVRADIRFDYTNKTSLGIPRDCVNRYDLQSIATHEFGHAFGLKHPGTRHRNLTMAPYTLNCSTAQRTLGKGDWRGMRALYGMR